MAEPPSIFAIFTDYDLDIKYLLKVKNTIYYCNNIIFVALKRNAYFLPKRKNTGIYIPIIQDKTFNQRKSTCNIMNKMQDERET